MRYDIISDTHGYLSKRLLDQLQGADTIVHAGDICSASDYRTLSQIAPVQLCLGNNDWSYDFGPEVKRVKIFFSSGLRWEVCHYRERLDLKLCDIAICGHTHRPFVEKDRATGDESRKPHLPALRRPQHGTHHLRGRQGRLGAHYSFGRGRVRRAFRKGRRPWVATAGLLRTWPRWSWVPPSPGHELPARRCKG